MGVRNSIKKKTKRFNQEVYDLTELGYNLRIIFMKSLYKDGSFSDKFISNISNAIGEMIIEYTSSPSLIIIELLEIEDHDITMNIIDKAYMDTLYYYSDEVNTILSDRCMDISISDIPIMTNITRYGNSINIVL